MTRNNSAAATPTAANLRDGGDGSFGGAGSIAAEGACTGAAETCTGGGGQVFSPLRTTVMARWTTSSKSMTSWPSFPGVSSVSRLTRFCPYSWDAWAGSRPARSV